MKLHIALARGLIRLGAFIQKSAVMVMTSDELVEFSRQHYAKLTSIEGWNRDDVVAEGLHPEELQLLERLPPRTGQLLLLGVGGGREAISFARMGFDVTGVDFIPEMVEGAIANAARYNVQIKGLVQDIAALNVPTEAYDVVWIFAGMYSCLPSCARRVQMLRHACRALKPGGYLACQFQWDTRQQFSSKGAFLCQIITWLTMGNRSYESGDMLWGNVEFIHTFSSESDLRAEFAAGGFDVVWLHIPNNIPGRGEALLQKRQT
jgi:SAM-dependent methyltransferase